MCLLCRWPGSIIGNTLTLLPKETASCNKDTQSLTSLSLGFRENYFQFKIIAYTVQTCQFSHIEGESHTFGSQLTSLQLGLYDAHSQQCAVAPLPSSNPPCHAQLDGSVCSCRTAAATLGHKGAREEEEDAQCSMAALLKRRMDSREIPGKISKIPFQKVKSRISS